MTQYIIIRGPLGIGKSTIAHKLASAINGYVVCVDSILAEQGLDQVPEGAECIPAESFLKVNELVINDVREKLEGGTSVIFDGNFYHKDVLDNLVGMLEKKGYSGKVFTLKAPVELCIERDSGRKKPHGKWAAIAVHNLVNRFDYGVSVDVVGKSAEDIVKEIKNHLN
ncbi:AAA family ATPase [Candidatus Woesearchaeota archaeon]|jgi:predicted kinase|nr:AAA family ATPase [Candidatus Woesearchaeota archaeon]MBT6518843.1 AAA family ATPase [Candidatus Woesearchaeota archaeon]MBT7367982.1 AAA family ATPase [Candidatus Woesearchaeota archaeon]